MPATGAERAGPRQDRRHRLRLPAWAWPLLALPVVAGVGVATYRTITDAVRARLQGLLRVMVDGQAAALDQFLNAQSNMAEVMAADPRLAEAVSELAAVARRPGADAATLEAAPAQRRLRELLAPVVARQELADFFVLD